MKDVLAGFPYSCDGICWDIYKEEIYDPYRKLYSLLDRQLNLCDHFFELFSAHDIAYFALKAAYPLIRHDFASGPGVRSLVNAPQVFTTHHKKNACALAKELHALTARQVALDRLSAVDDGMNSSALRVLQRHWEIDV
jgi:hypothetical protein